MATALKTAKANRIAANPNELLKLQKRYAYQKDRFDTAVDGGNDSVMKNAMSQMDKITEEAINLGYSDADLQPELEEAVQKEVNPDDAEPESEEEVEEEDEGEAEEEDEVATATLPLPTRKAGVQTKAQKEAEKVAKRAAAIAADKSAKPKSAPKPKKEKVLHECLDGCGEMVAGNFKMGHDAKLKSLILKVERGEEDRDAIPEIAQDLITFKKGEVVTEKDSKGQVKSKTQTFTCTKAPVRFPGRPEVELTTRD